MASCSPGISMLKIATGTLSLIAACSATLSAHEVLWTMRSSATKLWWPGTVRS